jgi:hypothetical protein
LQFLRVTGFGYFSEFLFYLVEIHAHLLTLLAQDGRVFVRDAPQGGVPLAHLLPLDHILVLIDMVDNDE